MTETTQPVYIAPTAMPANIATAVQILAGALTAYLSIHGKLSPTDIQTYGALLVAVSAAAWSALRNTAAAHVLARWMGAAPVAVIEAKTLKLIAAKAAGPVVQGAILTPPPVAPAPAAPVVVDPIAARVHNPVLD